MCQRYRLSKLFGTPSVKAYYVCVPTSVHDSFVVHVLEGATELNKVLPNGSFGYEATLLLEMFDHLCQVTGVG